MGLFLAGDGPLRRWVERRAAKVPGIFVAGRISDRSEMARHLASADALLHGCGFETFGLAVAEALCSGLPLVVARTGGAAELATADCAETYDAGDAAGCAEAILRLLTRDPARLREAAAAAAGLVSAAETHFDRLFNYYAAVADAQRLNARQPDRRRRGQLQGGAPATTYGLATASYRGWASALPLRPIPVLDGGLSSQALRAAHDD
jgi:alpha-1,6-mannosyltransferase